MYAIKNNGESGKQQSAQKHVQSIFIVSVNLQLDRLCAMQCNVHEIFFLVKKTLVTFRCFKSRDRVSEPCICWL